MPQAIFYYDMAYINPALTGVASLTAADVPRSTCCSGGHHLPEPGAGQPGCCHPASVFPLGADYNRRDTYVAMWNLAIQQQVTSTSQSRPRT